MEEKKRKNNIDNEIVSKSNTRPSSSSSSSRPSLDDFSISTNNEDDDDDDAEEEEEEEIDGYSDENKLNWNIENLGPHTLAGNQRNKNFSIKRYQKERERSENFENFFFLKSSK